MKYYAFFLVVCSYLFSQQHTDIIVWEMSYKEGKYQLLSPENITNRDGYDNQPYFSLDGDSIYYSSIREGENSDIYCYQLSDKQHVQITNTPEAEYSPTPLENGAISTVRVEQDKTQRIWIFSSKSDSPQVVVDHVNQIGYHCWLDKTTIAVFRIEETMNLKVISSQSPEIQHIDENIGRCLSMIPGKRSLCYLKKTPEKWSLYELIRSEKQWEKKYLVDALEGSEDFVWTSHGDVLMAQGNKIFACNPSKNPKWELILDATSLNLGSFSRMAVSGNRLATVVSR